ncbi:MAG: hypothetical protein LBE25_12405 [Arthrobacter sp.]|nr:hypothetical protein [Arthrobacter sp.]
MQNIINGGLTDQISALDGQGKILSDPNVWDGPLASQLRGSTWPETKAALDQAKQEMEQLQQQLQKISQDIFSAGGGPEIDVRWALGCLSSHRGGDRRGPCSRWTGASRVIDHLVDASTHWRTRGMGNRDRC